jgi:hypothetical protein
MGDLLLTLLFVAILLTPRLAFAALRRRGY